VDGRDEFDAWTRGEIDRPRRGWGERVLWIVLLLVLALVPVMFATEFLGPMSRF
jgi:hypothetical protein